MKIESEDSLFTGAFSELELAGIVYIQNYGESETAWHRTGLGIATVEDPREPGDPRNVYCYAVLDSDGHPEGAPYFDLRDAIAALKLAAFAHAELEAEIAARSRSGKIPNDWWIGAQSNATDEEIRDWFCAVYNVTDVEIDGFRSVWVGDSWLTQDEITEACATIDRGI